MEENKEVLVEEAQPAEAVPVQDDAELKKKSLMAFIFSIVAFFLCETVIPGIVFAAISMKFLKAAKDVQGKPHTIFNKVSKPLGIVALIFSILAAVGWFIYIIVIIVYVFVYGYAISEMYNLAMLF